MTIGNTRLYSSFYYSEYIHSDRLEKLILAEDTILILGFAPASYYIII